MRRPAKPMQQKLKNLKDGRNPNRQKKKRQPFRLRVSEILHQRPIKPGA